MSVRVKCHSCGQSFKVPDSAIGHPVTCGGCGARVDVPDVLAPPPADVLAPPPVQDDFFSRPAPPAGETFRAPTAPMAGPPRAKATSGMAVASLVLGIISILFCGLLLGPLAVIFGGISKSRIEQSAGTLGGGGMATAGIVTGIIGAALHVLIIVLVVASNA